MVIKAKINPRIKSLSEMLELGADDMRKITPEIDKEFIKKEKKLFSTVGASGGTKWAKLNKDYAKWKKKKYGAKKIMQRTGKLRKGLTVKGHGDHIARWYKGFNTFKVVVGTGNWIAGLHGAGGGSMRNPRLPVRDVMQLKRTQREDYDEIVGDLFAAKAKRVLAAMKAAMRSRKAN